MSWNEKHALLLDRIIIFYFITWYTSKYNFSQVKCDWHKIIFTTPLQVLFPLAFNNESNIFVDEGNASLTRSFLIVTGR